MPILKRVSPFVEVIDKSKYQEVLLEYEDEPEEKEGGEDEDKKGKTKKNKSEELKEVDFGDDDEDLTGGKNFLN